MRTRKPESSGDVARIEADAMTPLRARLIDNLEV